MWKDWMGCAGARYSIVRLGKRECEQRKEREDEKENETESGVERVKLG
jgi:hypothetical protein